MTVRREYKCNLCRSEITETGAGPKGGVGVHFGSPHLRFKMISDTETHLC